MTFLKKIILVKLFILSAFFLKAQTLPVHEQYIFDYMLVNPCFTGISEISTVKLTHRQQWVGIKEAPMTSFLLFRHRIKDANSGIGGYIFADQNGANSNYGIQLSGSYHLLLKSKRTKKLILSFGLSFRGTMHILDESKFEKDIYDPIINYGRRSTFIPNANLGILLSSTKSFFGYSLDNVVPYSDKIYNKNFEPDKHFIHSFHVGTIWQLYKDSQIRPALLFNTNMHGYNQVDISFRYYFLFDQKVKSKYVRYSNEFWVGVIYKHTMDRENFSPLSVAPTFGFKFNMFTLSYLYDFGLTKLQLRNYGTHQISLGIKFLQNYYNNWNKFDVPYFENDF